jgi:protein-tyrosine-phosphatase
MPKNDQSGLRILTLCTGNVARSAMLAHMLTGLSEANGSNWSVRSAGTHVTEGSAISSRTKQALQSIGDLGEQNFGLHRSHQLNLEDAQWADVILAAEAANVSYVNTHFPADAHKTVTLLQFLRRAPLDASFAEQLQYASAVAPDVALDVVDPAGKDQAAYDECADQLWLMAQAFSTLLSDDLN